MQPCQRPPTLLPVEEAQGLVTEWRLSMEHSLQVGVHTGDTLHVDHGTVWLSDDAALEPTAMCEGTTYTATRDAVLRMIGIDDPRVTVRSGAPVMVCARADFGAWRHRPPMASQ